MPKIMKGDKVLTSEPVIAEVIYTNQLINENETTRQTQETNRQNAESSRTTAENTRNSQESTRQSQENTRKTNETTRQSQESTRQSNETTRQNYYNAYKILESYNPTTPYIIGNKVTYLGSTYQNILGCTGVVPTNTTNWILIAQKGTDGTGTGDMVKETYDPQNKATDIFAYTDSHTHTQNTDIGTSSSKFTVGTSGVNIKNNGGTELQVRNNGDTDYADVRVKNLYVEGTTTQINSNTVNIGDSEIELNTDVTTSSLNSDGGITIKRLMADNTTRKDAKMTYNNSIGRWQTTQGNVTDTLVTRTVANKYVETIGDGATTDFTINHNLNTYDVMVTVRDNTHPSTGTYDLIDIVSANTISITYQGAPSTNQYTVIVIG